jgi:hypothetical protein
MEQVMNIFRRKNDLLFDLILSKTKELNSFFTSEVRPELVPNKFIQIIEGDQNSPLIMGYKENQHIIYYPKNSTPYLHQFEDSIKNVEILSGEIFDKITGKKYVKGDSLEILPNTHIQPYTENLECTVKVTVTKKI